MYYCPIIGATLLSSLEIYFWKMRLDQPFGGQACILYILSRYLLERRNLRTFQWFFWNHKGNLSIKISPLYLSPTGFLVLSKWIMPVSQYKHCHNENTVVTINIALNTTVYTAAFSKIFFRICITNNCLTIILSQIVTHNENTRLHTCDRQLILGPATLVQEKLWHNSYSRKHNRISEYNS